MDKNILKATHSGILKIADIEIDCAVLVDGRRVLSQRSVSRALGRTEGGYDRRGRKEQPGGGQLPVYLTPKNLSPYIPQELTETVTAPILFTHPKSRKTAFGLDAAVLPRILDVWLTAKEAGVLAASQLPIAKRADILMRGLAHVGIIALVDEATGYQEVRDRLALQQILERYIAKELQAWVKRFPDEFYREMFRLKGWQFKPISVKRPSVVGKYTNDVVYSRLAPGVLDELRRKNPPTEKGHRPHRHHQHLTPDVGHPELAKHISAVNALMRASANWPDFYRLLQRSFPKFGENMQLIFPEEDAKKTGS